MQSGESFGAEGRVAHYFLMAWKSGCSVPASDIKICTEYWQDSSYTLVYNCILCAYINRQPYNVQSVLFSHTFL